MNIRLVFQPFNSCSYKSSKYRRWGEKFLWCVTSCPSVLWGCNKTWRLRVPQHGVRSGIKLIEHPSHSSENWDKTEYGVLDRTGSRGSHVTDVFDLGRSTKELWKIHSDVQRLGWSQWMVRPWAIASSCRKKGEEPVHVRPVWLAKGKAMAAFRSAIAGNKEIWNLVRVFQLSDEKRKEPDVILKHLKEHFMASKGVLTERTERTKFAQMKQEHQESVTAWQGRVKQQGRRLKYCDKCEDRLLRDKFISGINNERLMSKLLDNCHRD